MLGRAGRSRLAPGADGLRAVQQAVLRSFAATGYPPAMQVLDEAGALSGTTHPCGARRTGTRGFLALDVAGQIRLGLFTAALGTLVPGGQGVSVIGPVSW